MFKKTVDALSPIYLFNVIQIASLKKLTHKIYMLQYIGEMKNNNLLFTFAE